MAQNLVVPPGFVPYPDPGDVFMEDVGLHLKVFHPILTIPAAQVDPTWTGQFHFVLPIEPYDGALGEGSTDYYGPHCGEAWIKFVRIGSKYRFAGDWRYFAINREHDVEADFWYGEANKSYAERRRAWHEQGLMNRQSDSFGWGTAFGGNALAGNWTNDLSLPDEVAKWGFRPSRMMREDETVNGVNFTHPLNEQGQRYRLIGILVGYRYRDHGADKLLMFYDTPSSTILIMLDFS